MSITVCALTAAIILSSCPTDRAQAIRESQTSTHFSKQNGQKDTKGNMRRRERERERGKRKRRSGTS